MISKDIFHITTPKQIDFKSLLDIIQAAFEDFERSPDHFIFTDAMKLRNYKRLIINQSLFEVVTEEENEAQKSKSSLENEKANLNSQLSKFQKEHDYLESKINEALEWEKWSESFQVYLTHSKLTLPKSQKHFREQVQELIIIAIQASSSYDKILYLKAQKKILLRFYPLIVPKKKISNRPPQSIRPIIFQIRFLKMLIKKQKTMIMED